MHQIKTGERELDLTLTKRLLKQRFAEKQAGGAGGGAGGAGRGRGGGNKKIDYKAKAIAGKQAAIGKQIDNAMSTGRGPND